MEDILVVSTVQNGNVQLQSALTQRTMKEWPEIYQDGGKIDKQRQRLKI